MDIIAHDEAISGRKQNQDWVTLPIDENGPRECTRVLKSSARADHYFGPLAPLISSSSAKRIASLPGGTECEGTKSSRGFPFTWRVC